MCINENLHRFVVNDLILIGFLEADWISDNTDFVVNLQCTDNPTVPLLPVYMSEHFLH